MLKLNCFYLQRPPGNDGVPFLLVKVMKVIPVGEPGTKLQWGAWCQHWEVSTMGEDVDNYADPYHASSLHKDGQVYKATQSPPWTYEQHALSTFQDEVKMSAGFTKPRWKHAH